MKRFSSATPFPLLLLLPLLLSACKEDPAGTDETAEWETTPWLFVQARAVNDDGVVVGDATRQSVHVETGERVGESRAVTWTQAGGMVALPNPDDVEVYAATDVDDHGNVLAVGRALDGSARALVWNGSAWTDRGSFVATALDEDGTIVGYTRRTGEPDVPVILPPGATQPQELSEVTTLVGCDLPLDGLAMDVAAGRVVGATAGWVEAFERDPAGETELLFPYQDCLAQESTGTGVNESGWVVGWSGGLEGAYVRRTGEEPALLPLLPGAEPGWGASCANDVADAGWIAGVNRVSTVTHAVRWNPAGDVEDLGEGEAWAVNDAGMTVGNAWPPVEFATYAVVWLADGTRIDLGGPDGTAGTPDEWDGPVFGLSTPAQPAAHGPRSLPCAAW